MEKAVENFFRKNAKYSKQKKYKDYTSMTFPQYGMNAKGNRLAMSFSDGGKLINKKIGEIDIQLHRPIEGTIKQLHNDALMEYVFANTKAYQPCIRREGYA